MDSQTDRRRLESFCLDGMIENGSTPQTPENRLNENFTKKEFQELWNRINHKYAYTVNFERQGTDRESHCCHQQGTGGFETELRGNPRSAEDGTET